MSDDLLGIGKLFEALEKGTREIREVGKAYFEPAAAERGQLRADKIRYRRFELGVQTCKKALQLLDEAGIKKRQFQAKLVFPILEYGSLEEDELLADKWAKLLASSAAHLSVHASYPEILKQLSPVEARILDTLSEWRVTSPVKTVNDCLGRAERKWTAETLQKQERLSDQEFEQVLQNLMRLGLCKILNSNVGFGRELAFRLIHLDLTEFGEGFVRACMGP